MTTAAVPLGTGARVLIVRLGALGDIVHALPVLSHLRTHRPDVRVDWLVDARYAQVLGLVDGVHQRVVVRARENSRSAGELRFAGRGGLLDAVRFLRTQRYEAALDLQGLIKSAALARASGARRVIGFEARQLREPAARWLYTECVTSAPAGAHVIDKNLSMLTAIGLQGRDRAFPWRDDGAASTGVARAPQTGADAAPYVLLNPGAAWVNKRWQPARFGALAAMLGERHRLTSVVTWAPGEEAQAAAVVAASGGHAVLAPPTTLRELLTLARGARLVVSGDTGPLHLAATVRAPIVGLFGPTTPERNGPWDAADVCVSRAATCACHHKRQCLRGNACIEEITVDEVYAACERRLRDARTP